jgi:succinoglycan biosynthesis transport protein ExoP
VEIRDYLRMLRRGWLAILAITVAVLGMSFAYLALAPKTYSATTVLYVSANDPKSITDLQQGSQFTENTAVTFAELIQSATVLRPVAQNLRPQENVDDLVASVSATVREETMLIDVSATGSNPARVAEVANQTAASAIRVVPTLERGPKGTSLIQLQQVQQAVEPTRAVSPNPRRILALGLIVGLLLGLAITISVQALDTKIRRAQDLQDLVDIPVLGVLPLARRSQRRGLVARNQPSSGAGEAYRTLRTNLGSLGPDVRSVLFAGVGGEADDALVPANLAWSLASYGRRVALVDLDLRHTSVATAMGLAPSEGVADVLARDTTLDEALVTTASEPRLRILPSGTSQPSPSELLGTTATAELVGHLESQSDYVLLHAPALLTYTDAAVASGFVDGTIITLRAGKTTAQDLQAALRVLSNVKTAPVGIVLTHVRRSSLDKGRQRRVRFGASDRGSGPWNWTDA